ncbi:hypothetical protein T492DRAFT_1072548 [Pavlovales sp. CCMP2436]|nr:hypothetical protein T492DRAFT_1072548 [Pavlovales sp. CCMP2436]
MERVRLNVGGVRYETTRTTLTQFAGSYFSAMFGGLHPDAEDEDGRVFIDRDGDLFRHVLNYMRTGSVSLPQHREDAKAVHVELAYNGLSVPTDDSSHAAIPGFTRQELQSLHASDARLFTGARLAGVDLSKLIFDEVRLDRADLRGACLADTSWEGTSLVGSLLQHSDLRRARLVGASCIASDFQQADLRGADLTNTNLSKADLRNARIDTMLPTAICGANLFGLDLRGGVFPGTHRRVELDRPQLEGESRHSPGNFTWQGVNFSGVDLRGVCLRVISINTAWGFVDCNFDGDNLEGVRFEFINHLRGCTFQGANLTDAIVTGWTHAFDRHRLYWAQPGTVDFQGATLTRASITPIRLSILRGRNSTVAFACRALQSMSRIC